MPNQDDAEFVDTQGFEDVPTVDDLPTLQEQHALRDWSDMSRDVGPEPDYTSDKPDFQPEPMPTTKPSRDDMQLPQADTRQEVDRFAGEMDQHVPQSYGQSMAAPQAPPGGRIHTTTVRNGPYESRQHYLLDANDKVVGSYQEGKLPQESVPTLNARGQVAGYQQRDVPSAVNAPYADPEKQALVKQEEGALDQLMQDKTLSPQQRESAVKARKANIAQLDPNGWFRKGGVLSQQTEAAKWMAQKTIRDPVSGTLIGLDAKGTPHALYKPPDKEELELKHQERLQALDLHKQHMAELILKNKIAQETHVRDQQAKMEHWLAEELRKEEGHLFGHEDKIDPLNGKFAFKGERTPSEKRHEAALASLRRRRGSVQGGKFQEAAPSTPILGDAAKKLLEARKARGPAATGDPVMDYNLKRMGILP